MKKLNNFNASKETEEGGFVTAPRRIPFTQIPNELLRDKRLRPDASWLICLLLSYPDDWHTSFTAIQKAKEKAIGRDALRTMIKNAIECEYMVRRRYRLKSGRFSWQYVVFGTPAECREWKTANGLEESTIGGLPVGGEVKTIGGFSVGGETVGGETVGGLHVDITNTDLINIDLKNIDLEKDAKPPSPVSDIPHPNSLSVELAPWDAIAAQCGQLEAEYYAEDQSNLQTSDALESQSSNFGTQPEIQSGTNNCAVAAILPPEKKEIKFDRENSAWQAEQRMKERAAGLPAYRTGWGANGIKLEFVEAMAKKLSGEDYYKDKQKEASPADAKSHIISKETQGLQALMVDRYNELCVIPTQKEQQAASGDAGVSRYQTQDESLVGRMKGKSLMSGWVKSKKKNNQQQVEE